ncbi:tetratricopeptide repeat-containing diguanylate cyclase [Rheinheimera sp.]|uniref:tetratricopeptide repeat-containing diguanylate cyclase n=1 Tax=Rheinheimera sp. TaxID=1869214 RepID=UPI0027B8E011|nr:tetratricopeptide repeat-containing diguanylate cyclase [Rheinheimera sp.]
MNAVGALFHLIFCFRALPRLWLLLLLGSFAATAAVELDTQLEQQLEQYLVQANKDENLAGKFLFSLEKDVSALTPINSRVRFYVYKVSEQRRLKDHKGAAQTLTLLQELAQSSQDPDVLAEINAEMLVQYWDQADFAKAITFLEPTLIYAAQATQSRVRYYAFNIVANFQTWQGKYDQALESYHSAYDAIEKDENPRTPFRRMNLALRMANLQSSLKNFVKSNQMMEQSLPVALQNPDLEAFLPDIYIQLGFNLVELEDLEAAAKANLEALKWAKKRNLVFAETTALNNLGDIAMRQRKLPEARQYFEQCLKFGIEQKDKNTENMARFNLGYVQVLEGKFDDGLNVMQSIIDLSKESGAPAETMDYLTEMADAYQLAGLYQQEAKTLREHAALAKDIFKAESERQINQLQEEFSAKEKSKEIAGLKQQNQLKAVEIERQKLQQDVTLLIGIVIILAAVLLYLLYRKVQTANQRLKEANDQLAYQSLRDPLTGLYNRRSFQEQMEKRQRQVERRQLAALTTDGFILLDVDFFKHVNDHFGHAAGDAVLVEIANRLSSLTRNDDMVLRWGGEEFLILLRRVDIKALAAFTQRVLDTIGNKAVHFGEHQIRVTASAGFLTYPFASLNEQSMGWAKALQLADMALYLGKVHGRNRAYGLVQLNKPYTDIATQLETDLSQAIEQGNVDVMLVEGPQKTTADSSF